MAGAGVEARLAEGSDDAGVKERSGIAMAASRAPIPRVQESTRVHSIQLGAAFSNDMSMCRDSSGNGNGACTSALKCES